MLPASAADFYRSQQRLTVATLGLTRREWARMSPDFDASWARVGRRLTLLVASAQLGAARAGAESVPATLAELGTPVDPLAQVQPQAFAGAASDGRPLDTLLYGAVTTAKAAVAGKDPAPLAVGGSWLDMAVHTMIADAGRGAAGVAIATRPTVGYTRMVNLPCCSRCAILAGRFYRWNAGFQRHPRCDCRHVSCTESSAPHLSEEPPLDQIHGLTTSQRRAVQDGADLAQVVNADRRVFYDGAFHSRVSGMTTAEGTGSHGLYGGYQRRPDGSLRRRGKGETAPARLTPDAIYRLASDRGEALSLLRRYGYLL